MKKIFVIATIMATFTACADPEAKADPQGGDSASGQTPQGPQNTEITNSPPAGDTTGNSADTTRGGVILKSNVNKDSARQ